MVIIHDVRWLRPAWVQEGLRPVDLRKHHTDSTATDWTNEWACGFFLDQKNRLDSTAEGSGNLDIAEAAELTGDDVMCWRSARGWVLTSRLLARK